MANSHRLIRTSNCTHTDRHAGGVCQCAMTYRNRIHLRYRAGTERSPPSIACVGDGADCRRFLANSR